MDEKFTRERMLNLVKDQQKQHGSAEVYAMCLSPQAEKDIEGWGMSDLEKIFFTKWRALIKHPSSTKFELRLRECITLFLGTTPIYDCPETKVMPFRDLSTEEKSKYLEQRRKYVHALDPSTTKGKGQRNETFTKERLLKLKQDQQKQHGNDADFVTCLTLQSEKDIEGWDEESLGKIIYTRIQQGASARECFGMLMGTAPMYDCCETKMVLLSELTPAEREQLFEQRKMWG